LLFGRLPGDLDIERRRYNHKRALCRSCLHGVRSGLSQKSDWGGGLMKNVSVLMVGVGGQGVILASDILSEAAMNTGHDVKKSDSIGMAQRGGSVVSNVRFGEKVFSPLIGMGEADYLIGFEELEADRWAPYLKKEGVAIVADVIMVPLTVSEKTPYPSWDRSKSIMGQVTGRVYHVPATEIGKAAHNTRALNMVLLGFLSSFLVIKQETWHQIIKEKLPARFVDSSIMAFNKGAEQAEKMVNTLKEAKK
jgi:indolepyruvate ferredoxin oxidoreductase beta subunit